MSKFKVGDQVTIKPGTRGIGGRKYGVPYTVTHVFKDYGGAVEFDSTVRGESVTYADSEVELYEPEAVVEAGPVQDSSRGVFVSLDINTMEKAESNVKVHDSLLSALKDSNGENRQVFFVPYPTPAAGRPVWEAIR